MAIYRAVESQRGQLNQIILKEIPHRAMEEIMKNNAHPVTPRKLIKQNGIYVPAIKIKIME